MEIISREKAKENGDKYYFTGNNCKHGHLSKRATTNGACYECKLQWERDNPRKSLKRIEYMRKYLKEYKQPNRKETLSRHYEKNRDKELARSKKRRKENKEYYNAKLAERRARKKLATPIWFDLEKIKIKKVYEMASKMGLEVDHVVPITSDLVCGLHCWDNLQLLSRKENAKKLNKYWPDMPGLK